MLRHDWNRDKKLQSPLRGKRGREDTLRRPIRNLFLNFRLVGHSALIGAGACGQSKTWFDLQSSAVAVRAIVPSCGLRILAY